MQSALIGMGS